MPKKVDAVDWKIYKNTILVHSEYSLVVSDDGYMAVLPDDIFKSISVSYDGDERLMTVKNKQTKKDIFYIKPVLKAVYDEKEYKDYSVVLEASGYYYLAKIGNDTKIKISIDDLAEMVKSIN